MIRWVCGISASTTASYSRMPSKRRYSAFGRLPLDSIDALSSATIRFSSVHRAARRDLRLSLVTRHDIAGAVPMVKQLRGLAVDARPGRERATIGEAREQPR